MWFLRAATAHLNGTRPQIFDAFGAGDPEGGRLVRQKKKKITNDRVSRTNRTSAIICIICLRMFTQLHVSRVLAMGTRTAVRASALWPTTSRFEVLVNIICLIRTKNVFRKSIPGRTILYYSFRFKRLLMETRTKSSGDTSSLQYSLCVRYWVLTDFDTKQITIAITPIGKNSFWEDSPSPVRSLRENFTLRFDYRFLFRDITLCSIRIRL